MHFLAELSLKRGTVVLLAAAAILVAGLIVSTRLKTELIPNLEFPVVTIMTAYPGAGPEDVAEQVSKPVEQAISGIPRLESIQSTSAENMSILVAQFEYGTKMKEVEATINSNLKAANLPSAAMAPKTARIDMQIMPIVQFSLSGEKDVAELERIAREKIVPELLNIDGVYAVDVTGGARQQIDIVLDPVKMRNAGISAQQVAGVLKANNLAIPSGSTGANGQTLPIRTMHQFTSLSGLEDLVVGVSMPTLAPNILTSKMVGSTPSEPAVPVMLKDIASVKLGRSVSSGLARTNGRPSVGISVAKSQEANTVSVANGVSDKLKAVEKDLPTGVEVTTILDQSTFIEKSVDSLLREGGLGAIFAIIIVFAFLVSVRSTLVTAVSIPLSVVVALILLDWQGLTINIMTLGGLSIAVGRVVDDSIVVLENIYRHAKMGEQISTAVRTGTREVASAITSSTLTTICVFLPLGLVGGLVGQIFLPFALTVTFALLASLLVALTVVPVLAKYFIGSGATRQGGGDTWLQRLYTPVLRWALRHRAITLGIAAAVFLASFALLPFIPTSFMSNMQENVLTLNLVLPPGADEASMLAKVKEVEGILGRTPGVDIYSATVGSGGGDMTALASAISGRGTSSANFYVRLRDDADLEATAQTVRQQMKDIKGAFTSVSMPQSEMTGRLQVVVSGQDSGQVHAASQQILESIQDDEGLVNLRSDVSNARPEIAIRVDPNKAMMAGLTTAQVASGIRDITTGQVVTQMRLDGSSPMDVHMALAKDAVSSVEALRSLPFGSSNPLPLSSIAEVKLADGPVQITRVNQKPAATITGDIVAKNTGTVSQKLQSRIDGLSLPSGVHASFGGVISQMSESFYWMFIGIGVAIVLVYLVMVIVFGSLLDPFVILFSLPLASIGVLASLFLTGRTLGMSALIGVLMLVGIVVTNAIVLIDFVKQLVDKGYGIYDALIEGGRLRVRPILMTALATILALIPLSLGFDQGTIIAAELGTVVIGGLLTSTLLTLVVVPVVYSILESLKSRLTRGNTASETGAAD